MTPVIDPYTMTAMRKSLLVATTVALLAMPATVAASTDGDAETAFAEWAATGLGVTVEKTACSLDGSTVTCYGLWADSPSNPNWSGVFVAVSIDGGATFTEVPIGTPGDATSPEVANTFGDGIHIVGTDIQPGTYRAEGTESCYWARLSGFSGDDIITNDIGDGTRIVEILATDVGFESSRCGTWSLVSL